MHVLPIYQRILLLTEGHLGVFSSKTAAALLRYRAADVVGIVDAPAAGTAVRRAVPWAPPVPIVADVPAAQALRPQALFIGIAPPGGALPPEMRRHVSDALRAGLDVVSGLHLFLADDAEFARLAAQTGVRLIDLRRPPAERIVATGRARETRCRRVLTVGTDGNVGKMVTALELTAAAAHRGIDARFLATGQTGIMIAGRGVTIDAIASDFAAGAVEELVLSASDSDICVIEGQGSIAHPGFSTSAIALLHGAWPDALILVHHVGRNRYRAAQHVRIPPLTELRAAYEQIASLMHPARVVGVALNAFGQPDSAARLEARRIEQELRLPVSDPTRPGGCERLLAAALAT